jgi:hypothetical protein
MKLRGLILSLCLLGVVAAQPNPSPPPKAPLPLRRVVLAPDKVLGELKRVADGTLVRLSQAEFERYWQAASRAVQAQSTPPRLLEARYRASLTDEHSLIGSAEWKIHNPNPGPALLPVAGLNLALRSCRFENREAYIADFLGNNSLGLLVDQPGDLALALEWSARVEKRPEGLQIELQWPECAVAQLELTLPAGRVPVVPEGVLLAGPRPAEAADLRIWTIACGGRTTLPLLLRDTKTPRTPSLFAEQRSVQTLSPAGLEAIHTFRVETMHRSIEQLVLELDPRLRTLEVSSPELERWENLGKGRLRVRFTRPIAQQTLEVRALAALGNSTSQIEWDSPGMGIEQATSRGETLELALHPSVEVVGWRPGDFRLMESSESEPNSLRLLRLQGGGVAASRAVLRRPSLEIRVGGARFRTNVQHLWRIEPDAMELIAQVRYRLERGELYQLRMHLPTGWDIESVESSPPDLQRGWSVRQEKDSRLLSIDLRRMLQPSDRPYFLLRLRSQRADSPQGALPFPEVVPLDSRFRESGLAIDYDHQTFRAQTRTSGEPLDLPEEGPWSRSLPELYYAFRGEPLLGTLELQPRDALTRSRIDTYIKRVDRQVRADFRLTLEAEGGRPTTVDVLLPGASPPAWEWQFESGESRLLRTERRVPQEVAQSLAGLASRGPLELVAYRQLVPTGNLYRLTFDRPLVPRRPVVLRSERPASRVGDRWNIPLAVAVGATRFEGQVSLAPGDVEVAEVSGLTEVVGENRRRFRYDSAAAKLVLQPRTTSPQRSSEAVLESALLSTQVQRDGTLEHVFRFELRRWNQRSLPLALPEGGRLFTAQLEGQWIDLPPEGPWELPVPASGGGSYVLRYKTAGTRGLFTRLEAPLPVLPVTFLQVRRLWFLPRGMRPLGDEARALPGVLATGSSLRYPIDVLRLGPLASPPHREGVARREIAQDALAEWVFRPPESLGKRVEWLLGEFLQDAHPLVVDTEALGSLQFTPETLLTPETDPMLEPDQLDLVALPAGLLLTRIGRPVDEQAYEQALLCGREESGGYELALHWLQGSDDRPAAPEGWLAWAPVPGSEASLTVVEPLHISALGMVLAALQLLSLMLLRRFSLGVRIRWVMGMLALAGVILAWLPSGILDLARWPLLAGLFVGLPWAVLSPLPGPRRRAPSTAGPRSHGTSAASSGASPSVSLGLLLLTLAVCSSHGQIPPAEQTVFLLDGERGDVLASPALLKRLETLARSDGLPRSNALLTRASYSGQMVGSSVEFAAKLQVFSAVEEAVPLVLPFDGVQLVGEMLLDGAKVLPRTLAAPRVGYEISVRGKGEHVLEMRFRVPISTLGEAESGMRQVRCGLPRLAQSQLRLDGPVGATHLSVTNKLGLQSVTQRDKIPRLEADLGPATGALTLRWYVEPNPPRPAEIRFREAYWWDLRPEGCILNAALRYTLSGGASTGLALEIPPELEVLSAQARRPRRSSEPPLRLRDWYLHSPGGKRQLQLDFPGPVSGEVEVDLVFLPRVLLAEAARLPLPRPLGRTGEATLSYLGYRVSGLEAERTSTQGLTGIGPSRFAEDWSALARPTVDALTAAFTFQRRPGASPELRLRLRPRTEPFTVVQTLRFVLGNRRAEWNARVEIRRQGTTSGVMEWDLGEESSLTLTDVTGEAVSRWTQNGRRVLLWLNRTEGPVTLEMTGMAPVRREPQQPLRFAVPCIRPLGGQVRTALSWESRESKWSIAKMTGLVSTGPDSYTSATGSYAAMLEASPLPGMAARMITRLRGVGREVFFESQLEFPETTPREVGLKLRGWPGVASLEVEPTQVVRRRESFRRYGEQREQRWQLQPLARSQFAFRVVGSASYTESSLLIPELQSLTPVQEHRVVIEPTLVLEGATLFEEVEVPPGSPPGSRAIRLPPASDASLRVQPRRNPGAVLLAPWTECRTSRGIGSQWLHQVTWWLRAEESTELTLRLPAKGTWLEVVLDGEPVPAQSDQQNLSLFISGSAVPRPLQVRYRLDPGQESITLPELRLPQIDGLRPGPTLWTVDVPVGWDLSRANPQPLSPPRALALRHLSLVEAMRGDSADWEEMARLVQQAETALQLQPEETLAARLATLREELGPLPAAGPAVEDLYLGSPYRWIGTEPPLVRLHSRSGLWPEHALGATVQWAAVWFLVWLGSYSPWLRWLAGWVWPELLALLGLVGWWIAGPTLAVGLLLLAAGLFRVLLLWRGLRRWLTAPRPTTTIANI